MSPPRAGAAPAAPAPAADPTDWTAEEGQEVETSRLRRAWRLGALGAKVTGGVVAERLRQRVGLSPSGEGAPEALHVSAKRNAAEAVRVMGQLKGAAMKLGQMLGADPDLIDPEFASALSTLQRQAPPMPFRQLKAAVEERLGAPLHEVFDTFDPRPLGAASIGQVHHAVLRDGRAVAVKVQYPGVRGSLASDLKNIESFLRLGAAILPRERLGGFMRELRDTLEGEADYLAEAQSLEDFNAHFAAAPFEGARTIRVPRPIREAEGRPLCGPELLVMEFVRGVPFHEGVNALPSAEERAARVRVFIEAFVYMFHDLNRLHADPHPGNFLLDEAGRLVILDFGCVRPFAPEVADGVLKILRPFWAGDAEGQAAALRDLGFGGKPDAPLPTPAEIAAHHALILEPMARCEPFNFSTWRVHEELRAFLSQHLHFIHLIPPPELIMYLRVVAGIKGTLSQINAAVDIRSIAQACCVRRRV
jgi:predicted unusual protein kinase regulating ubiquinone biosynthesis (AarF/ABC1/UbiB family)